VRRDAIVIASEAKQSRLSFAARMLRFARNDGHRRIKRDPTVRRREDSRLHAGAAGPYAGAPARIAGADVIKVGRREGEDMRRTPLSREWAERAFAPGWQAINGQQAQPDARSAEGRGDQDRQSSSPPRSTW